MNRLIVLISQNGWHGKRHLIAMFEESQYRALETEYLATVLWSIGKMLGGKNFTLPSYGDIRRGSRAAADSRGAQEIIDDIIGKLIGEGVSDNDESVYRDSAACSG